MIKKSTAPVSARALLWQLADWLQAGNASVWMPPRWMPWMLGITTLFWCGLTGAIIGGATVDVDNQWDLALHSEATQWLSSMMSTLTLLGNPLVLGLLTLGISVLLIRAMRRVDALAVVLIMGSEGMLNALLKVIVHRRRPVLFEHVASHGFSYPSGHAMATMCLTGVMLWLVWPHRRLMARSMVLVLLVVLLIAVGVSRVYLGVHYPSDVIGGWLAGAAWLSLSLLLLPKLTQAFRDMTT